MSIPPNSPYSTILDGYFGYLSQTDKNSIWNTFKTQFGLTQDPSNTDTQAITEFSSLVQMTYDMSQRFQLSPIEMANRDILFKIYDLLIKFMKTINDNVQVLSQNINFLSQYAAQYTKLISRIPIYIGNQSDQPVVNLQDLSKFTLGYDNISIQDILTYNLMTNNSFLLGGGEGILNGTDYTWNGNLTKLTFTPNSDSFTVAFNYGAHQIDLPIVPGTLFPTVRVLVPPVSLSVTLPYPPNATDEQKMEVAQKAFVDLYNSDLSLPLTGPPFLQPRSLDLSLHTLYETVPNSQQQIGSDSVGSPYITGINPPEILWRFNYTYIGSDEKYQARSDADADRRAQANQVEQQYIQNAASNRQILNDRKKQEQDDLQADIDNNKAANDIMQSLIHQLRDVVDAIYLKK